MTGAAHGLGRALAAGYAARGDAVTAIDRDPAVHANVAGVRAVVVDITRADVAEVILERALGPFDLVIHAAGISATGRFDDIPAAQHAKVIAVNLTAPMVLTAGLLAMGEVAPRGRLAFVASASVFTGYPGAVSYAASKDGLASFAGSLRRGLPRGMGVSTIYPGPLRTEHARRYAPDNSPEAVARRMPVDAAARGIQRGLALGLRVIVPGRTALAAAVAGRLAPAATERAMMRSLYAKLDRVRT
ncbi:MAG: SDR family NAD(P)-dependent oxidoreductase [Shimia sp.]